MIQDSLVDQVEYIMDQSMVGNHVLFDPDTIRQAAQIVQTEEDSYGAEPYLEQLFTLPTLAQKKLYLDNLGLDLKIKVARTYLNIIENEMLYGPTYH